MEKHDIRKQARGSPARPVRYVFSATKYSQILSRHGGNDVCEMFFFWRRMVRTNQRGDKGVGAGGGQPGSSTMVWSSLVAYNPMSFVPPVGGRLQATENRGRSQPEKRHGMAAAVLRTIRRRKNPVRFFLENIPVPNIFCGLATRSLCPTHPSLSRYPIIDMLPHAVCVGLS
jgi:hypothetical protein